MIFPIVNKAQAKFQIDDKPAPFYAKMGASRQADVVMKQTGIFLQ